MVTKQLNRVLIVGCLAFLVVLDVGLFGFVFQFLSPKFRGFFSFFFLRFRGIPSFFLLACPFWLVLGVIYLFPRWSSGYPPVHATIKFESRSGEILNLFAII